MPVNHCALNSEIWIRYHLKHWQNCFGYLVQLYHIIQMYFIYGLHFQNWDTLQIIATTVIILKRPMHDQSILIGNKIYATCGRGLGAVFGREWGGWLCGAFNLCLDEAMVLLCMAISAFALADFVLSSLFIDRNLERGLSSVSLALIWAFTDISSNSKYGENILIFIHNFQIHGFRIHRFGSKLVGNKQAFSVVDDHPPTPIEIMIMGSVVQGSVLTYVSCVSPMLSSVPIAPLYSRYASGMLWMGGMVVFSLFAFIERLVEDRATLIRYYDEGGGGLGRSNKDKDHNKDHPPPPPMKNKTNLLTNEIGCASAVSPLLCTVRMLIYAVLIFQILVLTYMDYRKRYGSLILTGGGFIMVYITEQMIKVKSDFRYVPKEIMNAQWFRKYDYERTVVS